MITRKSPSFDDFKFNAFTAAQLLSDSLVGWTERMREIGRETKGRKDGEIEVVSRRIQALKQEAMAMREMIGGVAKPRDID